MRTHALAAFLALSAPALGAQQSPPKVRVVAAECPTADSLLGPANAKVKPLQGMAGVAGELRMGFPDRPTVGTYGAIDPRLEMAAYPAPLTRPARPAELLLTLSGDPARKLTATLQPVPATLTLKDDTTFALEGTSPTVTGAPAANMAIAFVSFPLTAVQLARLAAAKDAKLEFIGQRVSIPKDLRRVGAEAYRAVLCGYLPAP